jgi:hypothetical protein
MFRDALASQGDGAPQLLDIAQLAARDLPEPEPPFGAHDRQPESR